MGMNARGEKNIGIDNDSGTSSAARDGDASERGALSAEKLAQRFMSHVSNNYAADVTVGSILHGVYITVKEVLPTACKSAFPRGRTTLPVQLRTVKPEARR
jgi:hypothetical protein